MSWQKQLEKKKYNNMIRYSKPKQKLKSKYEPYRKLWLISGEPEG